MTRMLLRIAVLTGVYLLCLTSLRPGDVLTGLVLSTLLAALAGRPVLSARPQTLHCRADSPASQG